MSRPSTSSSSRPSTTNSNLSRPSTSSTRPNSSKSSRKNLLIGDYLGPNLLSDTNLTIENEISSDILLKIMSNDQLKITNLIISLAEKGDGKTLQKLIFQGINISNCIGLDGFTPLHHAANRGNVDVVLILIKALHPIDKLNDSGESPLHLAAYCGHLLIVEQLLDCGANINLQNKYGETPLFYAVRRRMPLLVRLLLHRGADYTIRDDSGDLAIDHTNDTKIIGIFQNFTTSNQSLTNSTTISTTNSIDNNLNSPIIRITYTILQHIYLYLLPHEIARCACVNWKWHRASESEEIWERFGKRRWEFALQASLGFPPMAAASFRPSSKKNKIQKK